jgi:uncharacterized membrane protein YgcG
MAIRLFPGMVLIWSVVRCFGSTATDMPLRPSGPVADFANLVDNSTELQINTVARTLWLDANFGLLIVTVDSLGAVPVATFIEQLCREWRVWRSDSAEGALVLAVREPLQLFIEPARGSSYLSPATCHTMIQSFISSSCLQEQCSEPLLTIANQLVQAVSSVKGVPAGSLPAFSNRAPERTVQAAVNVRRYQGMAAAGIFIVLLSGVIAASVSGKKQLHGYRTPFGNVLTGEGFGGKLSGEKSGRT